MKTTPKIATKQIVAGAKFATTVGEIEILSIDVNGYRKNCDRVNTSFGGRPYSDTAKSLVSFINSNRK